MCFKQSRLLLGQCLYTVNSLGRLCVVTFLYVHNEELKKFTQTARENIQTEILLTPVSLQLENHLRIVHVRFGKVAPGKRVAWALTSQCTSVPEKSSSSLKRSTQRLGKLGLFWLLRSEQQNKIHLSQTLEWAAGEDRDKAAHSDGIKTAPTQGFSKSSCDCCYTNKAGLETGAWPGNDPELVEFTSSHVSGSVFPRLVSSGLFSFISLPLLLLISLITAVIIISSLNYLHPFLFLSMSFLPFTLSWNFSVSCQSIAFLNSTSVTQLLFNFKIFPLFESYNSTDIALLLSENTDSLVRLLLLYYRVTRSV